MRQLLVCQLLVTPSVGDVEQHQRVLFAQRNLRVNVRSVGIPRVNVDRHLAGRHLAPHAMNQQPILAVEALWADIRLGVAFQAAIGASGKRIAQHHAAGSRARVLQRADRPGRFLNEQVDVRFARPRHDRRHVTLPCVFDRLFKRVRFVHLARITQLLDGGLGQSQRPILNPT